MGLNNLTSGNLLYIVKGKIEQIVQAGTEGAIVKENGAIVKQYNNITGHIVDFSVKDSKFAGKRDLYLKLRDNEDGGTEYTLVFGIGTGYFTSFARAVPNINIAEPVSLSFLYRKENDEVDSAIFVRQGSNFENLVERYYKADNKAAMKELPEPNKVTVKGLDVWDYTEQEDFLLNVLREQIEEEAMPF